MKLTLSISQETLQRILSEATPLRIHLGKPRQEKSQQDTPHQDAVDSIEQEARFLMLERPKRVHLCADRGLFMSLEASLRYSVAGFTLPWTIPRLDLILEPRFKQSAQGLALAFVMHLEDVEFANLPALIHKKVLSVLKMALGPETLGASVPIEKFLRADLRLPDRLEPLDGFHLRAEDATVRVSDQFLELEVHLDARLSRQAERL